MFLANSCVHVLPAWLIPSNGSAKVCQSVFLSLFRPKAWGRGLSPEGEESRGGTIVPKEDIVRGVGWKSHGLTRQSLPLFPSRWSHFTGAANCKKITTISQGGCNTGSEAGKGALREKNLRKTWMFHFRYKDPVDIVRSAFSRSESFTQLVNRSITRLNLWDLTAFRVINVAHKSNIYGRQQIPVVTEKSCKWHFINNTTTTCIISIFDQIWFHSLLWCREARCTATIPKKSSWAADLG